MSLSCDAIAVFFSDPRVNYGLQQEQESSLSGGSSAALEVFHFFLSLSNFLSELETSVSAYSHMQVHPESFVPSLMSNFMVLKLEAGGGGWSHVLYKELWRCQIAA